MTATERGPSETQNILLVPHTGRSHSMEAATLVCRQLVAAGAVPVVTAEDWQPLVDFDPASAQVRQLGTDVPLGEIAIVITLGGDGTILRAAEVVRGTAIPLLGVNLGHVGFLAEAEREDLADTVDRVLAGRFTVEERMALAVTVTVGDRVIHENWALNEVTVEKASGEKMLEVVIEIDGRPLSGFGCDGVIMATPTGSTAYSFSAGGPVVWPAVEALLLVPLSAHALFSRPLVVGPESVMAVEVLQRTGDSGVLWCDGRRTYELPAGARVEATRSNIPVRLARLHESKFTDRLVKKFNLPVSGWRGPVHHD